ncbi:hypothetical protein ACLB2K_001227 [Fragaria x ananassa]
MATRGKLPSFFKIVPSDRFTNKLKIPTEFLQHFHGNVPHQCHLQTAARTCLVHVEVVNNKFYFQKGWNEFLQENVVKYGQLLVFHYGGNSHFHVDIFGKNTCGELFVMPETEVSLEISDESPVSSPLPSSSGKARMKNKEARWSKSEMKKKDRGGTSSTQRFIEKDLWEARIRAEAFKSENPSAFLVSMKPSYMKFKFVWLPAEFTMLVKPFIENSGDVFIRVSNGRVRT